jgi:hypothetical protein
MKNVTMKNPPLKDLHFIHPAFGGVILALEILRQGALAVGESVSKRRARGKKASRQARPGQALFAGVNTPLWNALASALKSECRKRGDQVKLARMVGLSRQRMSNFLHGKGGLPDAERALVLLNWLLARHKSPDGQPLPDKRAGKTLLSE